MSETVRDAQSHISGTKVARMLLEFESEFRGVYSEETMIDMFAVGPIHSFIGLAIKNGHLFEGMTEDELVAALDTLEAPELQSDG